MNIRWCVIALLSTMLPAYLFEELQQDKYSNAVLTNFVNKLGYPFEIHHIVTQDGYILTAHRIPASCVNVTNNNRRAPVVLIMHGLLGCSADWLLTGPNLSIAFLLADNGYDVWLGNSRGSTNSKNHTTLSVESPEFWNFSWHELGIYDNPAMIDYILQHTGEKQLFYVGYSQGTTQFWVSMSMKPEYNKKIKFMVALAPIAYVGHVKGVLRPLSFFCVLSKDFFDENGYFEVLPRSDLLKNLTSSICQSRAISQPVCELFFSVIGGVSADETDYEHLAKYLEFTPAGCSYKQLIHYSMGIQNPGQFRQYDYGLEKNLRIYNAPVPPEYPLNKITARVGLYNGLNDWLARPKDVELLRQKLPNVVEKYTVTTKGLNHFDFIYGKNIRALVYDRVIRRMNSLR